MLILRFAGFLFLITIGASLAFYAFTRNRRYLNLAWRIFQYGVVFAVVFMVFFVLERLILVL